MPPAQLLCRSRMSRVSGGWRTLTDLQRLAWGVSAKQEHSHGHLGRSGPLAGYNHYVGINSNLLEIGENPVADPPAHPQFPANLIGDLVIENGDGAFGLKLSVPSSPTRHTLVFGTKALSAGRSYPGRFVYLGLLPDPVKGYSDIMELYVARFGEPPANMRVFIGTLQQINGWRDILKPTSAVVPRP